MTDERDKPSQAKESLARTTARDVPFVRGAGSDSEPAPRGQRPAQLPRDPTYEQELAQVELAVLRDPERRDDPSTKQGGRRGHQLPGQAPESVTPESPVVRNPREVVLGRSPEAPGSGGRSVASGTLLSVGAVDPRGKTERTLETPRMFFSRAEAGGEAYFKPGKIPAVTVHQTLETETVKLSDSVDPRRAKTIPRMDRAALQRLAELEGMPESDAPVALSEQDSLDVAASDASSPRWNQQEYEATSSDEHDGQIHASLSPFRDQGEPSFSLDLTPTRPEPLAGRRASEPPPSVPAPDTSTIPTHRDLPVHRIEASRPPPAPASVSSPRSAPLPARGEHFESEGPRPTTASIAGEEPQARPIWLNFAAFGVALLVAVTLGWLITGGSQTQPASPNAAPSSPVALEPKHDELAMPQVEPQVAVPAPQAAPAAPAAKAAPINAAPRPPVATPAPQKSPASSLAPAPAAAPRKSKSVRETIF